MCPVRTVDEMADGVGFEPTIRGNRMPVFKTGAFDHSATHPNNMPISWRVREDSNP